MVRLTADLIEQSAQYTNPVRDRELDLRGKIFCHLQSHSGLHLLSVSGSSIIFLVAKKSMFLLFSYFFVVYVAIDLSWKGRHGVCNAYNNVHVANAAHEGETGRPTSTSSKRVHILSTPNT